jgi:integrase
MNELGVAIGYKQPPLPRDLRHEAISRFIERGLTIPEAASISGHKAQSMLLRYAHPDLSYIKKKVINF